METVFVHVLPMAYSIGLLQVAAEFIAMLSGALLPDPGKTMRVGARAEANAAGHASDMEAVSVNVSPMAYSIGLCRLDSKQQLSSLPCLVGRYFQSHAKPCHAQKDALQSHSDLDF